MKTYSVIEASEIVGIKPRAVQTRCKRDNVRKLNNKYLITDDIINLWRTKKEEETEILNATPYANAKLNAKPTSFAQVDLQVQSLQLENEKLKEVVQSLQLENEKLNDQLQQYDITDNERIEVFTNEQYALFEQRLKEWEMQRMEIEHQEQLFQLKQKSSDDMAEHYKRQFEYQRKQSSKILEIHQKLVDTINIQAKAIQERNLIEAVEKDIVDKNTHKPK